MELFVPFGGVAETTAYSRIDLNKSFAAIFSGGVASLAESWGKSHIDFAYRSRYQINQKVASVSEGGAFTIIKQEL
jgi:hypothetical protein